MKLRLKICLVRDDFAAIQLEFLFITQHNVSTGELWDLFQPTIKPDNSAGPRLKTKRVDVLIDISNDDRELVNEMDYILEFNDEYFNPVVVYEKVCEILAKDSRFDMEV